MVDGAGSSVVVSTPSPVSIEQAVSVSIEQAVSVSNEQAVSIEQAVPMQNIREEAIMNASTLLLVNLFLVFYV